MNTSTSNRNNPATFFPYPCTLHNEVAPSSNVNPDPEQFPKQMRESRPK